MDCPHCGSVEYIKDSFPKVVNGTSANNVSTITRLPNGLANTPETRQLALNMYLRNASNTLPMVDVPLCFVVRQFGYGFCRCTC